MKTHASTSETLVPTAKPQNMLDMFMSHARDDHDMEFSIAPDGTHFIEQELFRIEFGVRDDGLHVRLAGPNENALIFFKEEIVHHIADIDSDAAARIRWDEQGMRAREGDLLPNFHVLTVQDSFELFEGMQRVIVHSPEVVAGYEDGLHLRLILPLYPSRPPVWPRMGANGTPVWPQGADKLHARFVTIRQVRAESNEVDLDIVRHGDGLISQFAQVAEAGQEIGAMGPAGMRALPDHDRYFIAADGTGLPGVARLLETLAPTAQGDVIVPLPDDIDYLPPTSLRIHRVPPSAFEADVVQKAMQLTARGETEYAYFAGEFENAQALRKHFRHGLGFDKTTQISAAYWRRGKPGFGS
ncbi:siderophore-interacting protein [uncultured Roseobacter sp.]|uniref:siderophore-interacting protein n=1 Tax=uncultured Roseobacter sp. TaxID=114847 RepID=UPI00260ED215|nr:siderophore-interacting protein [uncultured Roseobacter sp.]